MAYILPNLNHQTILQNLVIPQPLFLPNSKQSSSNCNSSSSSSFSVSSLSLYPCPASASAAATTTVAFPSQDNRQHDHRDDFFVNVGVAVRTLRQDLPLLFSKDLNYDIYRDDITFVDPLNTFSGIEQYKLIFWALRFHGKILFKDISLQVLRIWQPSENLILIRWNLRGVPRVPWEAQGDFQGTSRYKLDRKGKIYEHKVDNLAFNFPQPLLKPAAASVLDLVSAPCPPTSPNLTFLWERPVESSSSSWIEFYQAVKATLDGQTQECLFATCS